jgi:integrase
MPKYKHGSRTIYQRTKIGPGGKKQILKTWWLDYYHNGKRIRESSDTVDRAEARKLLQQRLGQIADGKFTGPATDRVMFDELAEDFLNKYRANKRATLREASIRVNKHLLPFFGNKLFSKITTADVQAFIAKRQEEGASNGEINRELAALKRMFNLALHAEKISHKPYIPMLTENNTRKGFFERDDFNRLLAKLPDELRPVATLAYLTGWRVKSEILSLTWQQVDLEAEDS